MSYEWKPGSSLSNVLVATNGKIVGEVSKALGSGYLAIVYGKDPIETFYTEEQAKKAVEENFRKWWMK